MLIYDKIDTKLIEVGTPKKFSTEEKWITPIFYNGSDFDFTLRNKYVVIDCIEVNKYGKDYITIKSKQYADVIESICEKLGTINPIQSDGTFRATINANSKISENIDKIRTSTFNSCVSLSFPTIYSDSSDKKTLQIQVKNLVVIKVIDTLEIDYDELKEAH